MWLGEGGVQVSAEVDSQQALFHPLWTRHYMAVSTPDGRLAYPQVGDNTTSGLEPKSPFAYHGTVQEPICLSYHFGSGSRAHVPITRRLAHSVPKLTYES